MKRTEAARFLGVSLRTLDRIAASGRLSKGTEAGSTRPFVVYRRDELETLKAELYKDRRVIWQRLPNDANLSDSVNFRLDSAYYHQLQELAATEGTSSGVLARRIVIRFLEAEPRNLELEVFRLRESIGAIFYVLLTLKLGSTPAEARKIVAETMKLGGEGA
ncbi:MAG: ribbon-helix-helix protein, CopG family [Fimbriimonadaceae bacterium]|nr:ribbon-helix-helix protein, CopG family [Fimbriimonadaceae bacterium]